MLPERSGPRTLADWLAQPAGHRLELVDGNFVEKASPSSEHGVTQTRVGIRVGGPAVRRPPVLAPRSRREDLNVLAATANERVRPEPFGAVEFPVASFFDDAEDDEP